MSAIISDFRRSFSSVRWLLALLFSCLMCVWGTYEVTSTNLIYPSVIRTDLKDFDGLGPIDTRINFYYKYKRFRDNCFTQSSRIIWRWVDHDGKKIPYVVPLFSPDLPIADVGSGEMIVSYPIPTGITSGDWFYRAKIQESCGWREHLFGPVLRRTPDIPIRIDLPPSKAEGDFISGAKVDDRK